MSAGRAPRTWLVKTEPEVYGIADLERDGVTGWEGVRNYEARNTMRDLMRDGDQVLVYHSNAKPSGVAGLARVEGPPVPDPSQFDSKSEYFDPGSSPDEPRWMMVRLRFVERFPAILALERLQQEKSLAGMPLLRKGQRLSVQPVDSAHFKRVVAMARAHRS